MQSIRPKVLMVEEAGQVLEAHILASLVPSGMSSIVSTTVARLMFWSIVMHLICIGDPRQLRPTIATFCKPVCCV